jgi:hypothetical protein
LVSGEDMGMLYSPKISGGGCSFDTDVVAIKADDGPVDKVDVAKEARSSIVVVAVLPPETARLLHI